MSDEVAPLRLRAVDLEDLGIVSSMVQDAIVPLADMTYLEEEKTFILALNRFQWENAGDVPPYSRTHAGLRFDGVTHVARRNIPAKGRDRFLSLLAIAHHDDAVVLTFSGNAAIRLTVERLSCTLSDLGTPWPTQWKPGHDPQDDPST